MKKQWLVLLGVAIVLSGCTLPFLSKTGLSLPGVTPRATEADFAFIQDPILKKHFVAQANQMAYRIATQDPTGGTQTTEMQFQGEKFKYRMANSKPQSDTITIDDTTYVKDFSDNSWWMQQAAKLDQPEATELPEQPEDFKQDYLNNQQMQYKALGEEACGSLACHKYEETDPNQGGYKRVFWFDTKDFLLRKEQVSYGGKLSGTNEYSYDNVAVNVPSPTKPVPEGRNIYEYMFGGAGAGAGTTMPANVPDYGNFKPEDFQNMDFDIPDTGSEE